MTAAGRTETFKRNYRIILANFRERPKHVLHVDPTLSIKTNPQSKCGNYTHNIKAFTEAEKVN